MNVTVSKISLVMAVDISNKVPEFGEKYTEGFYKNRISGKDNLVIGGFVEEKLAGAIVGYCRYDDGSFYCWMAGVDPRFRGKGVFKAMMDYLEKWSIQKGYKSIKVKTRNNKREMLSYLLKYGYNFLEVEKKSKVGDFRILLEKII
ncbi:GNAT family N-acetyltransferase [Candidatus Curtissbacteria bacterium]|nr:GNAT family N-acetyltransferase [Candidatus Curtissbacteria bacterium]